MKIKNKNFDNEQLSGRACITLCEEPLNELDAIHQACRALSKEMPEHYKVEYDCMDILTKRTTDESGRKCINIEFGYEVKTEK